MLLVDLNYNFEFDWFVELSDNKLSDNNLPSELSPVYTSNFYVATVYGNFYLPV